MKTIEIICYIDTGFKFSHKTDIIQIDVPDEYDCQVDPNKIIENRFKIWLSDNTKSYWRLL